MLLKNLLFFYILNTRYVFGNNESNFSVKLNIEVIAFVLE